MCPQITQGNDIGVVDRAMLQAPSNESGGASGAEVAAMQGRHEAKAAGWRGRVLALTRHADPRCFSGTEAMSTCLKCAAGECYASFDGFVFVAPVPQSFVAHVGPLRAAGWAAGWAKPAGRSGLGEAG